MKYTKTISLNLGAVNAGLTLEAQPVDQTGADSGDPIDTGFVELFPGNYLWTGELEETLRGAVKFKNMDTGQFYGAVAVEPNPVSGFGPYVVTILVKSLTSGLPIANASVRLFNDTEDVSKTTGVDGLVSLNVKSGTFKRIVSAGGFVTVSDEVDVVGDEELSDVSLSIQSIPVVETEGMTIVTCLASDFGKPQKNVKFVLSFEDKSKNFVNGVFQPDKEQEGYTNANGRAELQVWPSYVLQDNDFEPATYAAYVDGTFIGRVLVPSGGGNLSDLIIAEDD